MDTVLCEVVIRPHFRSDRNLLANLLAKADVSRSAKPAVDGKVQLELAYADWYTLCLLEDIGILDMTEI